jgi:threonine/homoserine/homoserine lactone efflux protein
VDGSLLAFLGISAVVIITPGQDTALTIRNTLLGGRRAGVATAAGVALGQAAWTVAASAGVTAVLVASEPAFAAVRLLGAAYLIYLGLCTLRLAVRPWRAHADRRDADATGLGWRVAVRQGALSNLGNPKMAIFFSSLLPQFVTPGPTAGMAMAVLGLLFVALTLGWLSAYAALIARAGHVLRRPRIRRAFDALAGTLLVAFGARLALEDR